jgi:hypothetical protein
MSTLGRIVTCGAIAGFIFMSSGCIVAPDHGNERDRDARDHRDHNERHCDEHGRGDDCRDRYR